MVDIFKQEKHCKKYKEINSVKRLFDLLYSISNVFVFFNAKMSLYFFVFWGFGVGQEQ